MYLGDIDKEGLDWINDIVSSHLGAAISQILEMVTKSNNEIKVKKIIEKW